MLEALSSGVASDSDRGQFIIVGHYMSSDIKSVNISSFNLSDTCMECSELDTGDTVKLKMAEGGQSCIKVIQMRCYRIVTAMTDLAMRTTALFKQGYEDNDMTNYLH